MEGYDPRYTQTTPRILRATRLCFGYQAPQYHAPKPRRSMLEKECRMPRTYIGPTASCPISRTRKVVRLIASTCTYIIPTTVFFCVVSFLPWGHCITDWTVIVLCEYLACTVYYTHRNQHIHNLRFHTHLLLSQLCSLFPRYFWFIARIPRLSQEDLC